jgi:hypothetical protein
VDSASDSKQRHARGHGPSRAGILPRSWSPDGRRLLFTSVGATTALHVLSLADRTIEPLGAGGMLSENTQEPREIRVISAKHQA